MPPTSREIGTLIVVVLKARNLPNKRHIGKQDPYCLVQLDDNKRRTKAIKRGGQHPEWDEEIRITLYEDDSEPSAPNGPNGTPPPPPPKKEKGPPSIKGGKFMSVSCYAEDLREPDFIGETRVDLTEVLTKGETDEWFTLMNKDKYCGEVYLELTFWSNEPAPAKKPVVKHKAKKQYGGPGSFVPSDGPAHSSSENINDFASISSRLSSSSSLYSNARSDVVPPSLRPSSSMAKVDLYRAPYETNRSHSSISSVDSLANDFGQLNVQRQPSRLSRRTSLPQMASGFQPPPQQPPPSTSGYLDTQPQQYGYDSYSTYPPNDGNAYDYNRPVTPTSNSYQTYPPQTATPAQPVAYHPPYETPTRPGSAYPGAARHPRHSLPTTSSGFMPIPTPAPSSFQPITQQVTGYYPTVSATPAPAPSHIQPQMHTPPHQASHPSLYSAQAPPVGPVPTPTPSNFSVSSQQYPGAHGFPPSSASYHSIPLQQQPAYQYQYPPPSVPPEQSHYEQSHYEQSYYAQPPPTVSAPPSVNGVGHHPLPRPPSSSVPQQHIQQPPPPPPADRIQGYPEQAYSTIPPPPPLTQGTMSPASSVGGSRPLPVPGANQVVRRRHSTIGMQQPGVVPNLTGTQPGIGFSPYSHIPPPPPLSGSSSMSSVHNQAPPPPPPGPSVNGSTLPYPPGHQLPVIPGPPPLPPPRAPSRAPSQSSGFPNAPPRQGSVGHGSPVYPSHPNQTQPQASPMYPPQPGQNQPHTPPSYSPHAGQHTPPGYPPHTQSLPTQNHGHASTPGHALTQGHTPAPGHALTQGHTPAQHGMYQHVPPPPPPSSYGNTTSHTMALAASSFHSSSPTQAPYPGPLPIPPQVPASQSHGYPVASGGWQ